MQIQYQGNDPTNNIAAEIIMASEKLECFFGFPQTEIIKIEFIQNQERMKKLWGADTPVSAMVDNKDPFQIYIYEYEIIEKYSESKKSEYVDILAHEIAHTFVTLINPRCFSWMNEGICEYAVDTNAYDNSFPVKNWEWCKNNYVFVDPSTDWVDFINHDGYEIAFNLTKYIIDNFGQSILFDLLRIRRDESKDNYEDIFSKITGRDFEIVLDDFGKTLNLR